MSDVQVTRVAALEVCRFGKRVPTSFPEACPWATYLAGPRTSHLAFLKDEPSSIYFRCWRCSFATANILRTIAGLLSFPASLWLLSLSGRHPSISSGTTSRRNRTGWPEQASDLPASPEPVPAFSEQCPKQSSPDLRPLGSVRAPSREGLECELLRFERIAVQYTCFECLNFLEDATQCGGEGRSRLGSQRIERDP